jgi:hypothetical protein
MCMEQSQHILQENVNTLAKVRHSQEHTRALGPRILSSQNDRHSACVADNEVVRPDPDDFAIFGGELLGNQVLPTASNLVRRP